MQRSVVALVLLAIALVVYAPIALGGKTWGDTRYHTEVAPPRIAAAQSVLGGEVPAWWEGTALGVPLLGEPSHGAAYPPTWIAGTPHSLDLLALVHIVWCAVGVALWARRLGASDLGGVVGGALVVTSAVLVSAALRGALPAVAHLPWLALAASRLAAAESRGSRVRGALAIAVLLGLVGLAGEPFVFATAFSLVTLIAPRQWRWLVAAAACGLAIASLQWIPAWLVARERAGAQPLTLAWSHVIDLVVPRDAHAWFPTIYVGAPVLVLAVLARPQLRFALIAGTLLVGAFVIPRADACIAALAVVAGAHAGPGFDRVLRWRPYRLAFVALALAPTAVALPRLVPTTDRTLVEQMPAWAQAAERVDVTPRRVFRPVMGFAEAKGTHVRPLEDAIATLAGASAAKWGLGSARSEDPARPVLHDRVWLAAAATGGSLLDRYSIPLAVLPVTMTGEHGFEQLASRGSWGLARYPASPSAAIVHEWIYAPNADTALARLFPPGAKHGLSSGLIVLHGTGAENQDEPGPPEPCELHRWDAGAIDVSCTTDRPAFAVISSTAARGWTAQLDGTDAPWLVADVMRRALPLPEGTHAITWRYAVPGLSLALVLAALGIAGGLALWLVYGRDPHARNGATDPAGTIVN